MEKHNRAGFIVILAVGLLAIATGVRLHRGEDVVREKYFKIKQMETSEELLNEASKEQKEKEMEAARERLKGGYREEPRPTEVPKEDRDDDVQSDEGSVDEEWEKQFLQQYRGDFEKECKLEDGRIRFRMVVLDAALGSRWYGLLKSTDRGLSWQVVSDSPFGGEMGMGVDFTFLSEEFGFATLMHNGGDEAFLYVTEDGGESYQPVEMEELEVTLENGFVYQPFDYPQMPYEEDGKLYVLCGQGADGDYDGGDDAGMALFESTDGGHRFVYTGIRKGEED